MNFIILQTKGLNQTHGIGYQHNPPQNKYPYVGKLSKYLSTTEATVQDADWNQLPRWENELSTTTFQMGYVTETINFGISIKQGKKI